MKLDVEVLRYLSREDFRVLAALEQGARNHDVVPTELVGALSGLRSGASKVLGNLLRHKLIFHDASQYDGYRLTYPGYDFLALRTLLARGVIAGVGRQVGVGKESDIFLVNDASGTVLALKLQRLGRVSFRAIKRTRDYLRGRRSASWLYMSRLAAHKEFAFMQALHDAGFPVPIPMGHNRHALVMTLAPGRTLSLVKSLPTRFPAFPGMLFQALMDLQLRLAGAGLIHCDFNEFNVLLDVGVFGGGGDVEAEGVAPHVGSVAGSDAAPPHTLTLIDFPQMVAISHPNAKELFERDVRCLVVFFARRFGYTPSTPPPTFDDARRAAAQTIADEAAAVAAAAAAAAEKGGSGTAAAAARPNPLLRLDVATEASGYFRDSRDAPHAPLAPMPPSLADRVRASAARLGFTPAMDASLSAMLVAQKEEGVGEEGEEEGGEGGGEEGGEEQGGPSATPAVADPVEAVSSVPVAPAFVVLDAKAWGAEEEGGAEGEVQEEGEGSDSGEGECDDDDDDEEEEEGEEEDAEAAAQREAGLAAERPPDGVRTRPSGHRIKGAGQRGGEAYLKAKRRAEMAAADAVAAAAAEAAGGAGVAIHARVKRGLDRAAQRAELSAASAKAGKGRGSMKDRAKQKARDETKGASADGGGSGFWG